jgi:thioredoxin-related protein
MQTKLMFYTSDGEGFNPIEQWSDNPILLIFYHTDCLGCTGRALPLAYEFSKQYPQIKLLVVHVDFPTRLVSEEEIQAIFTDGKAPFLIYRDKNALMYQQFQAEGTPHWLMFDRNGDLRHSIYGSQENAQNRLFYALEELIND